jgi:predicted enzyme related to lactoylglutathione lyase
MLKRIGWIQVFVSDMERAVQFYADTLGIGVRTRSPDFPEFVELATEGTILALNRPSDQWPEGTRLIGRFTGITLTVPDIESAHRSLSAKGVRFSRSPAKEPWGGTMTSLFDPDGNEISLLEWSEG